MEYIANQHSFRMDDAKLCFRTGLYFLKSLRSGSHYGKCSRAAHFIELSSFILPRHLKVRERGLSSRYSDFLSSLLGEDLATNPAVCHYANTSCLRGRYGEIAVRGKLMFREIHGGSSKAEKQVTRTKEFTSFYSVRGILLHLKLPTPVDSSRTL
jgi:hypothetical protein